MSLLSGLSTPGWPRGPSSLLLWVFAYASAAATTGAQAAPVLMSLSWRPSADPVVRRADSLTASGDTIAAIAALESVLLPRSDNAAAWHRYGILRWQRVSAARSGGYIGDAKVIAALRMADSALRLATKFAPDSAEYWMTLGRFNLQSGVGSMRFAAEQQMGRAFAAAERTGDSVLMAESADAIGMATWRRFESTRNRALVGAGQRVQFQTDGRWQRAHAKDFLATFANKIKPPTGADDYANAMEQFRVAMRAAPNALRYSRHVFMGLAVGQQWDALLALANQRATASPFDADARLARGLALQRLHRTRDARLAFDSALALMDENESATLFRIDRILPTAANVLTGQRGMDTQSFAALPAAQRATMRALFWSLNDPVSATSENEAELEFMARVVQSDWQWSDALQGVRGVDTDRGDIFVRYGPPDDEMTLPGSASVQQQVFNTEPFSGGKVTTGGGTSTSQEVGSTLAWLYRSGEVFFFEIAPGFGTARTPLTDQKYVTEIGSVKPAAWDNVRVPRRVDSLPLRTVRFRAAGDSTDVVIVSQLPLRSLVADTAAALDSTAVDGSLRVDLAVFDGAARTVARDSARTTLSKDVLARGGFRSWVRRVGAGASFIRVDAVHSDAHSDAQRTASATAGIDAARPIGFAISDVLLVDAGASPPSANAARWSELHVAPSSGTFRAGDRIGLVWENYDLASGADANRYRVAITIERVKRAGAAGLALRVLDGVGSLLQQGRGSGDRLSVSFDRNVAVKSTQVDYLALDWLGDARGEYRLRLEITDLVANRSVVRDTRFRVQ